MLYMHLCNIIFYIKKKTRKKRKRNTVEDYIPDEENLLLLQWEST